MHVVGDEHADYWVQQYLQDLRTRKMSAHTIKAYRTDLQEVLALVAAALRRGPAEVAVAGLSPAAMRSAFARYATTRAAATVARAWSTWNGWFAFLLVHRVVEGNPMQAIRRPKGTAKHPKPLRGEDTPEQLLAAVAAPIPRARTGWPERDLAVVAILLCTGVRSSELLGLAVADVAGRRGTHRISVHGKGGTYRSIPIDDSLHTLIENYLASRRTRNGTCAPADVLFVDTHGQPLRRGGLQYLLGRALRAAGIADHVPAGPPYTPCATPSPPASPKTALPPWTSPTCSDTPP